MTLIDALFYLKNFYLILFCFKLFNFVNLMNGYEFQFES